MSLMVLLTRCRDLSRASQDAVYSSTGVEEIVAILNRAMESIAKGKLLNRDELTLLFAPTGDLQETSMANGWADEYLTLSAEFDGLTPNGTEFSSCSWGL